MYRKKSFKNDQLYGEMLLCVFEEMDKIKTNLIRNTQALLRNLEQNHFWIKDDYQKLEKGGYCGS